MYPARCQGVQGSLPPPHQSGHTSVTLSLSQVRRYLTPGKKLIARDSHCSFCLSLPRLMKNEMLDILIIGLLVVLFASIYRKRASARLRCWVAGWILVLLHFAALLIPAVSGWRQELADCLSVSALLLSGVCFLFSAQ